jgi:flavin-dependent dehydrogenase
LKELNTDILIVGGGSAGVAAAYSASENNDVIIIEKLTYLGGKATGAEVGTICGLYLYSKSGKSEFVTNGFARYFAEQLSLKSNTEPLSNSLGLHYLPYHIDDYKQLCQTLLNKNNITVLFNTQLELIEESYNILHSAIVKVNNEKKRITFKAIIDCSGDN